MKPVETVAESLEMTAFQRECVNVFVHAAQALSVPRSVGEIYGLLYGSDEPLTMDDVIERLGMSKGSASQGLRWLRSVNAVRSTYVAGDRRDHFVAETELRRLAGGFLRESIEPRVGRGSDYLERLEETVPELPAGSARRFAEERLHKLRRWHRLVTRLLPLVVRLVGRA